MTYWLCFCAHRCTHKHLCWLLCMYSIVDSGSNIKPSPALHTVTLLKPAPPAARLSRITQGFHTHTRAGFHIHVRRPVSTSYAQTHTPSSYYPVSLCLIDVWIMLYLLTPHSCFMALIHLNYMTLETKLYIYCLLYFLALIKMYWIWI